MATRFSYARTYPAGVARTFDLLLPSDLTEVFRDRYGPIGRVREVRGQDGEWGAETGATRTIVLADRSTMHETLLSVDRPESFTYRLDDFRGPLRLLVTDVRGAWAFESAGTGVRVTWSWDLTPRNVLGRAALGPLRRLWTGYARRAFDVVETLLLPT